MAIVSSLFSQNLIQQNKKKTYFAVCNYPSKLFDCHCDLKSSFQIFIPGHIDTSTEVFVI